MAPRPQSWVNSYDDVDFDISLGRRSSSPHERQHMLAESAMPTTRRPSGASGSSSSPDPSSSSSSHTSTSNPRPSSTAPDARDHPPPPPPRESMSISPPTSPEPGPSFLRMPRSASFASSPLNPAYPSLASPFARPGSRGSAHVTRIASEESRALSMPSPFSSNGSASGGVRGSMILYRRADASDDVLLPPSMPHAKGNRASVFSISGDSVMSLSSDSKYPSGMGLGDPTHPHPHISKGGLVAYAYDPSLDDDADAPMDEEDLMHDPSAPEKDFGRTAGGKRSWRGFKNLAALGVLIAALLCLFVVYPIIDNFKGDRRERMIVGNTRINATGQADAESFDSRKRGLGLAPIYSSVDPDTPVEARTWVGNDGLVYEVVYSDEFEEDRRTFYPGDDPFWEAVDDDSHDPQRVTTEGGYLVIRADEVPTPPPSFFSQRYQKQARSREQIRGVEGREEDPSLVSGLLRTRAPFCMGDAFVDVGVVSWGLPEETKITRRVLRNGKWFLIDNTDPTNSITRIIRSTPNPIGSMVTNLSLGIPVPDTGVLRIDYVRIFRRVGIEARSLTASMADEDEGCEGPPYHHVDAVLDVV